MFVLIGIFFKQYCYDDDVVVKLF